METLNCEKNCVQLNEVAATLDVSHGSVHHIINGVLEFHRVSMTSELKERCVSTTRKFCDDAKEKLMHSLSA
jgi:hypothetical protein